MVGMQFALGQKRVKYISHSNGYWSFVCASLKMETNIVCVKSWNRTAGGGDERNIVSLG